jgi:diguanylate cyclase (GGDEF)-like protein
MQESPAQTDSDSVSLPSTGGENPAAGPDQPFAPAESTQLATAQTAVIDSPGAGFSGTDALLGATVVLLVGLTLLGIRMARLKDWLREARESRDSAKEEVRHLRSLMAQMEEAAEEKAKHRVNRLLQRSQQAERDKEALEQSNTRLRRLIQLDDLTGVANVQELGHALDRELRRARRSGRPVSLVIADLDGFRAYNRLCGHDKGDDLLKRVAHLAQSIFRRGGDMVGRIAGDRFAIIIPDGAYEATLERAERLRTAIAASNIPVGEPADGKRVTISLGVTTIVPDRGFKPYQVFERAVLAMRLAKQRGGNLVRSDRAGHHSPGNPGHSRAGASAPSTARPSPDTTGNGG